MIEKQIEGETAEATTGQWEKIKSFTPIFKNGEMVMHLSILPDSDIYINPDYELKKVVSDEYGAHYRIVHK